MILPANRPDRQRQSHQALPVAACFRSPQGCGAGAAPGGIVELSLGPKRSTRARRYLDARGIHVSQVRNQDFFVGVQLILNSGLLT